MAIIHLNLINFPYRKTLSDIFGDYSNDFEFTANGIFRRTSPPICPNCDTKMVYNGFNPHTKSGLGSVKTGRYSCSNCGNFAEEGREFWKEMKSEFFDVLTEVFKIMRNLDVSYEGIASVMEWVFPRGKDTIYNAFTNSIEVAEIPSVKDIMIAHYDEQHPKKGRIQKYRLTLMDGITNRVIAEELHDRKNNETIKKFFKRYLDPSKPIYLVTDLYRGYPKLFKDIFGENLTHQHCLFHLNKLIVEDFPRKTTMAEELIKYKLLNIFYNRAAEIEFLRAMAVEEEKLRSQLSRSDYVAWLKKKKLIFKEFLHDRELKRRREKRNLEQRSYGEALNIFEELKQVIDSFTISVQKRLIMIEKDWSLLTAFYFVKGAPATNNIIENYYSTSLKTHRKKQLRTDEGIKNHMKLSEMKRAGMLDGCNMTLLEAFLKFIPFLKPG